MLTVGVATYQRPSALKALLESLAATELPVDEILVVDNDPERSAASIVERFPLARYVSEPRVGISYARNRLLDECGSRYLLSLDDDERPNLGWGQFLMETIQETGAAMVAGPVSTEFETPPSHWFLNSGVFQRPEKTHLDDLPSISGGNLAFDVAQIRRLGVRYDHRFRRGGEDIHFSLRVQMAGGRIIWDQRAGVTETAPASRTTKSWVRSRWTTTYRNHWRARMAAGESGPAKVSARIPYNLLLSFRSLVRGDLLAAERSVFHARGAVQALTARRSDRREAKRTAKFVANWLPQYREAYHIGLRSALASRGIEYQLSVAEPEARFRSRGDQLGIPWAHERNRRFLTIGSAEVIFDPITRRGSADVVILELQAKILSIPIQLIMARLRIGPPVMFFGQGSVDRTPSSALARSYKKRIASAASGWLVYTESGRSDLIDFGVAPDAIHVINNTTDVPDLCGPDSQEHDSPVLKALQLGPGPVLLHIGGLESSKRLDLVFNTFDDAKDRFADLQLVIAGGGPEAEACQQWAAGRSDAHWLPPQFGQAKVALFQRSDLLLHPGKLGLVVIDSFAAGVPIVGAHGQMQAPEFDYLDESVAFLSSAPDSEALLATLTEALENPALRTAKSEAARLRYDDYPMSEMVRRSAAGINSCMP